ncbi:MAG: hypothetical protein J6K45_04680 [Clostridia bacterium]|nr:hypothetical protein [Clostridia bacterium]
MENYIDYDFYKSIYKGNMSLEEFEKVVTRASIEVRNYIMNKNIENHEEEVGMATCSVADILYKIESIENKKAKLISSEKENRIISSEKVADLSKNYANTTSLKELDEEISNQKNKIKEEIENYLMFTGLLNRSVYGRFI